MDEERWVSGKLLTSILDDSGRPNWESFLPVGLAAFMSVMVLSLFLSLFSVCLPVCLSFVFPSFLRSVLLPFVRSESTPADVCVCAVPSPPAHPKRGRRCSRPQGFPKPPQGQRHILEPGRREGSPPELSSDPSTGLNSPDLALDQVLRPRVWADTKRLPWEEKNGAAGGLLREKAQGRAQLLPKRSPCVHLPLPPPPTPRRHMIRIPTPGGLAGLSKWPAQALTPLKGQRKPRPTRQTGQRREKTFLPTRCADGQGARDPSHAPHPACVEKRKAKLLPRDHLTPGRMAIRRQTTKDRCGSGGGAKSTFLQGGWACTLAQPLRTPVRRALRDLRREPRPCDTAIPSRGVCPDTRSLKETHTLPCSLQHS